MWRIAAGLLVVYLIAMMTTVHNIHEGYVGVYWRGGALLNSISNRTIFDDCLRNLSF